MPLNRSHDIRKCDTVRYAIYFTPAESDSLTQKASHWLSRNAFSDQAYSNYASFAEMTAEPRRYGFHATLKAPFELSSDYSEAALIDALTRFTTSRPAFDIPEIVIGSLGPFFALVPASTYQPLQDFAADVVEYFEPFRAPLSESDIARRKPQNLSDSQRHNLTTWGYPHVMDDFRFHMTLTGPVEESQSERAASILAQTFSDFTQRPLTISGLGLFVEKARGDAFTVHTWQPLG